MTLDQEHNIFSCAIVLVPSSIPSMATRVEPKAPLDIFLVVSGFAIMNGYKGLMTEAGLKGWYKNVECGRRFLLRTDYSRSHGYILHEPTLRYMHDIVYRYFNPRSKPLQVNHSCGHSTCLRLEHLRGGTHASNWIDLIDHKAKRSEYAQAQERCTKCKRFVKRVGSKIEHECPRANTNV